MGLLDQVGGALGGALSGAGGGGAQAVLLQQVVAMLSKPGALQNLMGAFQNAGLGNILQSWLGTGANLPIDASQITKVLGSGTVSDLAQKAGISEGETASTLSSLLPQVVDKISPDGAVPSQAQLGGLLSSLGKMLG
jgi:uncharacterized protein YidB (DUF937 family)